MKAITINNIGRCLLVCIVALAVAACDKHADQRALKLAHSLDINHPVHKAMAHMATRLEQLSGGTMRVDIYPSGQLGSERELIELLQIGSLAMTKVSASPLEGFVPEMKVFSIPYVFRDQQHFWQVLNGDIGRQLLLAPERVRLRGLGYYDAGSRSFYTTEKPIRTPSDLDGLKIRVMKSQTAVATVENLGGAATPIAWGELYTALQQGVVDGAENNPPTFYLSKHFEVAKFYTLDEHTSIPDLLLISRHIWQSLDSQQQQWLQTAVDESVEFQRALWQKDTQKALKAVADAGVEIIYPDKSLYREKVVAMHESYQGTTTGALLKKIAALPSTTPADPAPGSSESNGAQSSAALPESM